MQLSPHFTLAELTTHRSHLAHLWTEPTLDDVLRLKATCAVLELIRAESGPLDVDSGFRGSAYNTAIGGSPTSAHRFGLAADIKPLYPGVTAERVAREARQLHAAGKLPELDQVILYHWTRAGDAGSFVHVGLARPGATPRGQFLSTPGSGGSAGPYVAWTP